MRPAVAFDLHGAGVWLAVEQLLPCQHRVLAVLARAVRRGPDEQHLHRHVVLGFPLPELSADVATLPLQSKEIQAVLP